MDTPAATTRSAPTFDAWATTCAAMAEGIALVDGDGAVTRHNAAFARLLRLPAEQISGRPIWSLWEAWGPLPATFHPLPFERMRRSLRVETTEILHGQRWLHVSASPILSEDGMLGGAVYVVTDVTDRKAAERALRDSEDEYRTIFELSSVGLAQLDPTTGRFLRANAKLAAILGYGVDALCGKRFAEVAANGCHDEPGSTSQPLHHIAGGVIDEEAAAQEWRRADGASIWVRVAARVIREPHGHPQRVVVVVEDLSEQKRAEAERLDLLEREHRAREEAETANRAKDDFLATVSHELRTPLQAVLGWIRLLKARQVRAEPLDEAIAAIERNASAQVRLIEDLLDTARIEKGKLRLDACLLDLVTIVRQTVAAVLPLASPKAIEVEAALPPGVVAVRGDSERLRQVMWNLLTNAVKFTPPGGRVQVAVRERVEGVTVEVRDTGEGVPADFLPYVFEPFRQREGPPTRRYHGLGIGLTLVRQLVESHGGRVSAASNGVGRGSTFSVSLPRATPNRGEEVPRQPLDEVQLLSGLVALVADADPDGRATLASALSQHGAKVLVAGSAGDALAMVHHQKPDVLVTDPQMGTQRGDTLVQAVCRIDCLRPAIIAVTASTIAPSALFEAGIDAYIPKPVDPDDLTWVVHELARERRSGELF